MNVAQVTYAATYPERNYAPNLATLGIDPRNPKTESPEHAGLLDENLAMELHRRHLVHEVWISFPCKSDLYVAQVRCISNCCYSGE